MPPPIPDGHYGFEIHFIEARLSTMFVALRSRMRSTPFKFALLALCCIVPFLIAWLPDYGTALRIAHGGNYWLVAALFSAFAVFVFVALRRLTKPVIGGWLRVNRYGLLTALALAAFLQANEPHQPKVLYDEDSVCGIAWYMHWQRTAAYPAKSHIYEGRQSVTASTVDKRPVGFPFLLSTVHDLIGYRTANVYILNALLGFAFLAMLYLWAKPVCGHGGALAAILLVGSLPLLAQNVTGAGFEVFNICLIVGLALAARRYLEKPGTQGLDLLICVGLLLSVSRYESILYLLAIAAVVVVKWLREKSVTLTWFAVFSPLLLTSAVLTNRIFVGNKGCFEPHGGKPFLALSNFADNAGRALYYLFALPGDGLTNSLLLSVAGLAALIVLAVCYLPRLARRERKDAAVIVLLAVGAIIVANTLLGLFENWGQWDDPLAARFSLPFQMLLVLCFVSMLAFVWRSRRVSLLIPFIAGAWLLAAATPIMSAHVMTNLIYTSHDAQFFRDWARKNCGERDLIVDESCIGLILDGHSCIPFEAANHAPWKLKSVKEAGIYDHVYVFERTMHNPRTGNWDPFTPLHVLNRIPYRLRYIAETDARLDCRACIYEVIDVYDPELEQHPKPEDPAQLVNWKHECLP